MFRWLIKEIILGAQARVTHAQSLNVILPSSEKLRYYKQSLQSSKMQPLVPPCGKSRSVLVLSRLSLIYLVISVLFLAPLTETNYICKSLVLLLMVT